MSDEPALLLFMAAVGLYVLFIWIEDYRAQGIGHPNSNALPGAAAAPRNANLIAVVGAVVIVAAETWGEIALNVADQQSEITVLLGLYTLVAAFVEELIFRGYLVVQGKGKAALWGGIIAASALFAILHPFLWKWDMAETSAWKMLFVWKWNEWFEWQLTPKGAFSSAIVFLTSIWFYTVRFAGFNPTHSLLPCILAHAAKNGCVFIVKGVQGYIIGWW